MPTHYDQIPYAHYLTFSCYHNLELFVDSINYELFLESLEKARNRFHFKLYGFVIMPNHVHLLIFPDFDIRISAILTAIKQPFAHRALEYIKLQWPDIYAHLWAQVGSKPVRRFWQEGGGYDSNLFSDEALEKTLDYMHLNPVRKCLVERAVDWKWSSSLHYHTGRDDLIKVDAPDWR
jgi:putative transposase